MEELLHDEDTETEPIVSSLQFLDTPPVTSISFLASTNTTISTSSSNEPAVLIPISIESTRTNSSVAVSPAVSSVGVALGETYQSMSLSEREQLVRHQLGQLMMQSTARFSNTQAPQHEHTQHTHTHSHAHPHTAPLRHPPPVAPDMNNGQPAEMVLDMSSAMEGAPAVNGQPAPAGTAPQQAQGVRGRRRRQLGDQLQGIPGLGPILHNLEGAVPFILLLFAKVMYNHRLGLLVFVGMFGTFYYANANFKKLIALRDNQTWAEALSGYIWIFGFLAANIAFIYFIFADQNLHQCLYFQSANLEELDLWSLLWVTVITDFIVKFGTIAVKSLVAVLPKHIMPYKKKGKYFLLMESLSQCYRCVLPIRHWAVFMLENRNGGSWVAVVLFILYFVAKIFHLRKKCYELKYAVAHCRVDTPFGSSASREEMKTFDDTCPICQDIFTDAVKLSCKHIFCEDCICLWLDREKTCPMCRAHIVDNPVWRDGATAAIVQFF